MADRETRKRGEGAAIKVLFATMVIVLLAIIGGGVFYLVGERSGYSDPEAVTEEKMPDEARDLEGYPETLLVTRYDLERDRRVISGTVLNNTPLPRVNVQVGFDLIGIDSTTLTTVRDTVSEIGPGDQWLFTIQVPLDEAIAAVEYNDLDGTVMNATGILRQPVFPQTEDGELIPLPVRNEATPSRANE